MANLSLPKLRYNPLHDLESLWWIAAQFIIARAVTPEDGCEWSEEDRSYFEKHAQFTREVYRTKGARHLVMTTPFFFILRLELLHPAVRSVGQALRNSRRALVRAYKEAEMDAHTVDFHSADGVHEMLRDCFASVSRQFEEKDVRMVPIQFKL